GRDGTDHHVGGVDPGRRRARVHNGGRGDREGARARSGPRDRPRRDPDPVAPRARDDARPRRLELVAVGSQPAGRTRAQVGAGARRGLTGTAASPPPGGSPARPRSWASWTDYTPARRLVLSGPPASLVVDQTQAHVGGPDA